MNINSFGGASLEAIKNFEKSIGFSLPEDYKQFLIEYNGEARVRYSTFKVEELNENIPLDVLYGLGVEKKQLDLQKVNDEYIDDMLPNCIIIGDDLGAGMIVLINDDDYEGVYYWDHSFHFAQSSEEENIYKVADSFKAFIDGLKNPQLD
ncbi:SMI1/KNR4 family protein [Clostridium kluyveri]|uniref:SMI1/KNR4 family protein n=1 Tax=Clostridium kluyveri TaxID=1534 RepID=UPI0022468A5C|nr:SMI1/KNR4 family protein [Clostridium kluyveri]UZQ51671.1 SMI1/KNR4 family protein [Clostridium kluyveri]